MAEPSRLSNGDLLVAFIDDLVDRLKWETLAMQVQEHAKHMAAFALVPDGHIILHTQPAYSTFQLDVMGATDFLTDTVSATLGRCLEASSFKLTDLSYALNYPTHHLLGVG